MNQKFVSQHSLLPPEYVSGGYVTKRLVYKSEDTEVAILTVAPGASINPHVHDEDSELYFFIGHELGELCSLGSSHYFENLTNEPCQLLSVKTTKKPEIRKENGTQFVFGA